MKTINLSGNVIPDEYADMYDFFGMPAISPSNVQQQLDEANGDDVTINLSSNGGVVTSGSQIYTALKAYSGKVQVNITGIAASAASFLAMAADKILISPTAQMMIHKAQSWTAGNADDHGHESTVLDKIDNSIANAYMAKTGLKRADVIQMMSAETWMTAQDAVDKGFADEIMFVDNTAPSIVNAVGGLPDKMALNTFLNFCAQQKKKQVEESTQDKEEKQPTASLYDQKLAILMGKDAEKHGN